MTPSRLRFDLFILLGLIAVGMLLAANRSPTSETQTSATGLVPHPERTVPGAVAPLTLNGVCPGLTYAQVLKLWGRPLTWSPVDHGIWFEYGGERGVWFSQGRVVCVQGDGPLLLRGRPIHRRGDAQSSMRRRWGAGRCIYSADCFQVWDASHLRVDFDMKGRADRFYLTAPCETDPDRWYRYKTQHVYLDGQCLGEPLRKLPHAEAASAARNGDVTALRGSRARLRGLMGWHLLDVPDITVGHRWRPAPLGGTWHWRELGGETYRCEPHGLTVRTRNGVVESLQLQLEDAELLELLNR